MRLLTHVGAVHLVKLEEITGPIMHVAKLKGARDRKRGRGQEEPCGAGRLLVFNCEVLKVAKDHCGTSAELTLRGCVNERGRPFSAASIAAMLAPGLLKPTRMLT